MPAGTELRFAVGLVRERIDSLEEAATTVNTQESRFNLEDIVDFAGENAALFATFGYATICLSGLAYAEFFFDPMDVDIGGLAGIADYAVMGFTLNVIPLVASVVSILLIFGARYLLERGAVPPSRAFMRVVALLSKPIVAVLLATALAVAFAAGMGMRAGNAKMDPPVAKAGDDSSRPMSYVRFTGREAPIKLEFISLIGGNSIFLQHAGEKATSLVVPTSQVRCIASSEESAQVCGRTDTGANSQLVERVIRRIRIVDVDGSTGVGADELADEIVRKLLESRGLGPCPEGDCAHTGLTNENLRELIDRIFDRLQSLQEADEGQGAKCDDCVPDVDFVSDEDMHDAIDGAVKEIQRSIAGIEYPECGNDCPTGGSGLEAMDVERYARQVLHCEIDESLPLENPKFLRGSVVFDPAPWKPEIPQELECPSASDAAGGNRTVWIIGSASLVGDRFFNSDLAERRAREVEKVIKQSWCGVDVRTRSVGEDVLVGLGTPPDPRNPEDDPNDQQAWVMVCADSTTRMG